MARKLMIGRSQLPQFVSQYAADGILPFEAADLRTLERASQCIACARCDTRALVAGAFEALGPGGPMAFVLGVARHSGEHDAAELSPSLTERLLAEWTEVCPVSVPFAPLADLVRRRKHALESVRGATQKLPAVGV
jgi:hypothetical protein